MDRNLVTRLTDGLAVALAMSLPWSTSATGILVVLFVVALIPIVNKEALRSILLTPAGVLPVVLWTFGLVGMAWSDVPLSERLDGLNSFHKLLLFPLLLMHFERSERAHEVLIGFLVSCGALLAVSWALFLFPGLPLLPSKAVGIPVKDYIAQSAMFIACIAILIELARGAWLKGSIAAVTAYLSLAIIFTANIFFVSTSRTGLVVLFVIVVLFGIVRLNWKACVGSLVALVAFTAFSYHFSAYLQQRITVIPQELSANRSMGPSTSMGERIEFWKKSVEIIAVAPIIGHGTGTIADQFRRLASGKTGMAGLAAHNPHNQILAVGIQLGVVGVFVLLAMWGAHLTLFRGAGAAGWIGFAVVAQNIVGSLFNSHLFDFTHGWGYVIGVSVTGGAALKGIAQQRAESGSTNGKAAAK